MQISMLYNDFNKILHYMKCLQKQKKQPRKQEQSLVSPCLN